MTRLRRIKGVASGVAYTGLAAAVEDGDGQCIVIAPSKEALRRYWERLTGMPLNEAEARAVAAFGNFTEREQLPSTMVDGKR